MSGRSGVVILAVLCAVLSGLIFFTVGKKDTVPPEITFEKKSIYYDGQDTSTLLNGVSASDDQDGDVTESVIISAIYPVSDQTGVVVYAAKDAANNVTTQGRGFYYEGYDAVEAIGLSNAVQSDIENTETADVQEEGSGDTEPESDIQGSADGGLTEEAYEQMKETNLSQGIPFVRLLEHEVVIEQGSTFNIYRYIAEAVDDVDTISTMLRVRGSVDTTVPGEYEISVLAKDSSGNESNVEILKVTVE